MCLARAAYHLGNRHTPVQLGEDWLRYREDHVLDAMIRRPWHWCGAGAGAGAVRAGVGGLCAGPWPRLTTRLINEGLALSIDKMIQPRLWQLMSPPPSGGCLPALARPGASGGARLDSRCCRDGRVDRGALAPCRGACGHPGGDPGTECVGVRGCSRRGALGPHLSRLSGNGGSAAGRSRHGVSADATPARPR